jgi:YHS domain-containing protein
MSVKTTYLVIAALFAGLVGFYGCKKSEPAPAPKASGTMQGMQGHESTPTATKAAGETTAATEQTTCPVMGEPIDKNIFVEYKGKKVYFCSPGCKAKFEKDPEKYIAKLPQFKN